MSTLEELRKIRIKKLERLRKAGVDPYPAESNRTHTIGDVLANEEVFEEGNGIDVVLDGRIRALREHGGATFFDIVDESGRIQCYMTEDHMNGDQYALFVDTIDVGDFVECMGETFTTKRGQPSVRVAQWHILAKSLRPLPEEWFGLKDNEERFRRRYLDLLMNEEVRKRLNIRSRVLHEIRAFLEDEKFTEVETPMLQTIPGGATATPFKTHLDTLDLDLYLRIAPELYLKRLLVGGFERVYDMCRNFRNEGMDREHNPEFTMLEFYAAYQDEEWVMDIVERLITHVIETIGLEPRDGDDVLNVKGPWKRQSYEGVIKEYAGVSIDDEEAVRNKAKEVGLSVENEPFTAVLDQLFKKVCRPKIREPLFMTGHPVAISPLAKRQDENPERTRRVQLIMMGMEIANAFSELNDPLDQRERFQQQEQAREEGDTEAHPFDESYIEALEYGMPPAAGVGIGIDRLLTILTNAPNVREIIAFPLMKPKKGGV